VSRAFIGGHPQPPKYLSRSREGDLVLPEIELPSLPTEQTKATTTHSVFNNVRECEILNKDKGSRDSTLQPLQIIPATIADERYATIADHRRNPS
jgi:hypothetical protein